MTYYCKLCDISMMIESKYNQLKSVIHEILDESIKTRYFFQDPNINDIDEIMRKCIIM